MPDHLHGPIYLTSCVRWKQRFIGPKVLSNSGECWEKPAEDIALVVYLATIIVSVHEIFLHVSQCKHIILIVTISCPFPLIPHSALVCHVNVCHGLSPRNTSPSSAWGQQLLNCVFFFFFIFTAVITLSACDSGPLFTVQLCLATTSGSTPVAGSPRSRIWLSVTLRVHFTRSVHRKWFYCRESTDRWRSSLKIFSDRRQWTKRKESLKARDALCCTLCDRQPNRTTRCLHLLNSVIISHVKDALASDWLEWFSHW